MNDFNNIILGLISVTVAFSTIYGLAYLFKIKNFQKTRLKQQLYQSGETILPRERRYLDKTFIWISYFSISHAITFMFATLLIITISSKIQMIYPLLYFFITFYAICILIIKSHPDSSKGRND